MIRACISTCKNGTFCLMERTVVIEFPSYEDAKKAYDSADYKMALKELEGGADRDLRIVEGV